MKRATIIFLAIIVLNLWTAVFGQQENNKDQALRGSGRINPSTLAMEFSLPLGAYPGRGINVPISLSYSSKVWRADYVISQSRVNNPSDCISINIPKYAEDSASGWTTSLATPYLEYVGMDNVFNDAGTPTGVHCDPNSPGPNYNVLIKRLVIHLPSGETHELQPISPSVSYNISDSPPANAWNTTFYAMDGSNIRYVEDSTSTPPTYKLLLPDGSYYEFATSLTSLNAKTIRKATKFTDRNGNYTTYNDTNGTWTDTLGRTLTAPFGLTAPASPTTQTYTMPGLGGTTSITYKFYWKKLKDTTAAASGLTDFNLDLKYKADRASASPTETPRTSGFLFGSGWSAWIHDGGADVFNPIVLTEIELPTGQKYKFTYDVSGKIEKIIYPTGGEERFTYGVIESLSPIDDENVSEQMNFGVTNRKVYKSSSDTSPYEWNYSVGLVSPNGYKVTIDNPDGTRVERYLHRGNGSSGGSTFGYDNGLMGMAYEERGYDSSNPRKLMSKKLMNWTVSAFTIYDNSEHRHPRVTSQESIIYDTSGNGISTTTVFEYEDESNLNQRETPLLMKKSSQYAFVTAGSSLPSNPVRSSETTFLINDTNITSTTRDIYKAQNMVGLATASVVKDSAGNIVSRSEMIYDETNYSPNVGRGNPTTLRVWDSTKGAVTNSSAYIQTRAKFDSWGNQYEAIDAKGNSTTTTFDSTYHAFPIQVTSAIPSDGTYGSNTAFVTTATFNTTTGLPLTTTDANGLETRIEYDAATLRPLNVKTYYNNTQVGTTSETIYHDETNNYWVKNRTQIDTTNWAETITYFDGLGRAYKAEEVNSEGNIFVEKEFDSDGRVLRVTNPYRTGETKQWTTNVYDEASRIKEVVLPDGATVKTDYGVSTSGVIGATKQITDQAGKKRKGISDALGRMVRVIEDPTNQNLATDYVFDTLGNLRKTTQGEQNRYFTYDSLGRLLFAKQSEQEANTAFSYTDAITGNTSWSVKYEYDDNGNITRTTDARGVYVEGDYDNFNRLKTRNYSDSTPDVEFYYDGKYLDINDNLQTATGNVKGKTTGVKSSVSRTNYKSFDNQGRLLTHEQITDGQTYQTSYTYNLSGALLEETYPSGRVVKQVLNNDSELALLQSKKNSNYGFVNYASALKYNSSGAIERMRLGNARWETFQYNSRLQITQIGLGVTDADQNLLKLEYDYGNNTQNNGSLRNQKISFNGLSQSFEQSYTYDNLNRLQDAKEMVGTTQTWKQTFSYDRYGNRRFDANNTTTLGSCSEAVCNPLISTSDNRFSSGQGYTYDKSGNLTQDASGQQFIYDAANHQTEVKDAQNQTIGLYFYDGEGRRVKKISSTETTVFVYNGGGTLIAEYSTQTSNQPQVSYLTNDHLGSPRIITDQNGNVTTRKDYMAFGEETYTAQRTSGLGYDNVSETREGYTGYEKDDESGLDFAQARYFNSKHGRFTSVDPLTASVDTRNPQTFNRYSYALNSPYKFTDPLGLISSSTGADGGGRCNFECRVRNAAATGLPMEKSGLSDDDMFRLQFHIANGTALGYSYLNGFRNQRSQYAEANSGSTAEGEPGQSQTAQDAETVPPPEDVEAVRERIAKTAEKYEGSNLWNFNVARTAATNKKFRFSNSQNKCNLFVAEVLGEAGAIVPSNKNLGNDPLLAGNWGDPNYEVEGWEIVTDGTIKRGDVIATKRNYGPGVEATGHVAIAISDKETIGTTNFDGIQRSEFGIRTVRGGDVYVVRRYVGKKEK